MYKYFCAAVALSTAFVATQASAVPFDAVTANGTATVGSGGDYATLAEAATAFNGVASPFIQGNWKLEILNDLTEAANVGFGNTVPSGSSLTIKPASGTSVTLTFGATADNAGPSGNLLIGVKGSLAWADLIPTDNVTVDGSNNGTSSRNLTITNTPAVTHSFTTPLAVVGDCDNFSAKNSYIFNVSGSTGSGVSGICAITRYETATSLVPSNVNIINCYVRVPQTAGHGIHFRTSGTAPTVAPSIAGFLIQNCFVEARLRGIFLDSGINGTITSNTIRAGSVGAAVNGFLQQGIGINTTRSDANQTLNVANNQIFMQSQNSSSGDYGPAALNFAPNNTGHTINFVNNMVNFRFTNTASTANTFTYTAFRSYGGITHNILHNSINMPDYALFTNLRPTSGTTVAAAAIKLPQGTASTATIKNNIFRLDQAGVAGIVASLNSGVSSTFTSDNNVIFRDKSNTYTGLTGTYSSPTNYLTLDDWKTGTSQDAGSVAVNPYTTTGSNWQPDPTGADLHFVPASTVPVEISKVARLAEVMTDFDGESRGTTTLPGADEVNPSSVHDWAVY